MSEDLADVCFVYFRSLNLDHLDAAWYSLSRQNFDGIKSIQFLDNNTDDSPSSIMAVLDRYHMPVPVNASFIKHGDPNKTQSWSVNHVCREMATGPYIFFTRADYILAFDCIQRFRKEIFDRPKERIFVSGWCWQMSYDREAQDAGADINIEDYDWRTHGMSALLKHPYAFKFHETDQDAGVWMTKREYMAGAGWMNEGMVSWGYQQSTFQRALSILYHVRCLAIQDYLFAHQHHYVDRNFLKARIEYNLHGRGM
jgi:hypothetical protein